MRRLIRIIILLISIFVFYNITACGIYSSLILAALGGVALVRYRLRLYGVRRLIVVLLVALFFAVKYRFFPSLLVENEQVDSHWVTLFQCVSVIMLAELFFADDLRWRWFFPVLYFPAVGAAAGSVSHAGNYTLHLFLVAAGFVFVLADLSLSTHSKQSRSVRPGFTVLIINALVLVVVLVCVRVFLGPLHEAIHRPERGDNIFSPFFPEEAERFSVFGPTSGCAEQGRIITDRSFVDLTQNSAAVNIFARENPEYIRGSVYTLYDAGGWQSDNNFSLVDADGVRRDLPAGPEYVYRLVEDGSEDYTVEVWLSEKLSGRVFLAYNCVSVHVPSEYLLRNKLGMIESPMNFKIYKLKCSNAEIREYANDEMLRKCLDVPEELRAKLSGLAGEIFASAQSLEEKIAAVENYLENNYCYDITMESRGGEDPLVTFLLEKKSAHCQLFASAGAVLLRFAEVPTRYVQGFVVGDYDSLNKCWVATNGSAHAWVEVWDTAGSRWRKVDPTPGAKSKAMGLADERTERKFQQLGLLFARIYSGFRASSPVDGLESVLKNAGLHKTGAIILPAGGGIVLIFILCKVVMLSKSDSGLSRQRKMLGRLIRNVDRKAGRVYFERGESETVESFALRIVQSCDDESCRGFVEFYQLYGRVLYGGEMNEQSIAALHRCADNVT